MHFNKVLVIRVDPETRRALERIGRAWGTNLSATVRRLVIEQGKRLDRRRKP